MPRANGPSSEVPTTNRLRAGAGSSEHDDPRSAGREAARAAAERLDGETPALAVVLASVRYALDEMLAGIRDVTGATPLAGATTSGHFHDGTTIPPGRGVTVLLLTSGPYRFGLASTTGLRSDAEAYEAGRRLARKARAAAGETRMTHAAMLLLSDGLAGFQQSLLTGVHRVAGAVVPVAGGAASDDRLLTRTCVFHNDTVMTDGAVGIWIDSPHRLDVTVAHGWRPIGLPLLVTNVEGTIVHEIGGRPALDVFRDHFPGRAIEQALRYVPVDGWPRSHALGLIEPDGTQLIRAAFLDDQGHLRTLTPLPPYSAVQVVSCEPDDLLGVADDIVAGAIGSRDVGVLLAFSCVARLDILRERGSEEAHRIQAAAGLIPTVGFFTYGEFARTSGVAGYHNATVAAIAL
jgi:hypothetical protein